MVIINIVMICIILYHHGGILATMTLSVTWIYQCNSMYIILHSSEMNRASYGHDSRFQGSGEQRHRHILALRYHDKLGEYSIS